MPKKASSRPRICDSNMSSSDELCCGEVYYVLSVVSRYRFALGMTCGMHQSNIPLEIILYVSSTHPVIS